MRLALSRDKRQGKDLELRSIRLRALAAGRTRALNVKIPVPPNARAFGYRYLAVTVDAAGALREYSETNNTTFVQVP